MAETIDLYYSIRSPYSYLGLQRLEQLLPRTGVDVAVNLKPVMPIAVRMPEAFKRVNPLAIPYLERDVARLADCYGISLRCWPVPDPIVQDMQTLEIAAEQPYIYDLTYLMQCAVEMGHGFAFTRELGYLIWSGKVDNWDQGHYLEGVADSAGLSLIDMVRTVSANRQHYADAVERNQNELNAAGHWGVPTIVYRGEPFFGQDRIELFLWRLKQNNPV